MTKQDESRQGHVLDKPAAKRIGASVLVAAASLLGTSLGLARETPTEAVTPTDQNTAEPKTGSGNADQNVRVASDVKFNTPTPRVHVTTGKVGGSGSPTANSFKFWTTKQDKWSTNQDKWSTNQDKHGE